YASQPLDETFQFLVREPGASFPHLNRDDAPLIGAVSGVHHAVQAVTGNARSVQDKCGFRIRKKLCDLRRDIRSWEWLRLRTEFRHQPIEKSIPVFVRKNRSSRS